MTDDSLEKRASLTLEHVHNLVRNGEEKEAKGQIQDIIDNCKHILKNDRQGVNSEKNKVLIIGIMFRGLQNFIDLSETINSPNWITQPILVEKAWIQMWDCKERLEYISNFCFENTLDWVFSTIESLNKTFLDKFGPGIYFSAEFLVEQSACSICKKDFRSCEHISGRIYDGILCSIIIQRFQGKGVSIVENPEDPRCRIWPWKVEGNNINWICIMTDFKLDDFIDEIN